MKEIEKHQQDQVVAVAEIPVKKQHKLMGTLMPYPSQKVWEICPNTGDIEEAKREYYDPINKKSAIIIKPDKLYVVALNKKNALRKAIKMYIK